MMKTFYKYLILPVLLLWMHTAVAENRDSVLANIIARGREQFRQLQAQNQRNEQEGHAERNEYVLNILTTDAPPEREFIKQRALQETTDQLGSRLLIKDVTELDTLNERLRRLNGIPDNKIKTYLLLVDYVPMYFNREIPPNITLADLCSGKVFDDKVNNEAAEQARAAAETIVNDITAPFLKEQGTVKALFCGFLKFRTFVNTRSVHESIVYYPRHNMPENDAASFQRLLNIYISGIPYQNGQQFIGTFISGIGENNKSYFQLADVRSKIMQVTTAEEMEKLLRTANSADFPGLEPEERLHAIKVLAGVSMPDSRQKLLNLLLESVQREDADRVLEAMKQMNDQAPEKVVVAAGNVGTGSGGASSIINNPRRKWCLLRNIMDETTDAMLGFWGENNYNRLIQAFAGICKKSAAFKKQVDELFDDKGKLADRTILYTYNSFWQKMGSTILGSSPTMVVTPRIDRSTGYIGNCELETKTELFYTYLTPNHPLSKETLNPFEPIVFVNNSDLGMLSDLGGGDKIFISPAIILKYADDKAFNQTATDATMAAIDAASLLTGVGEIKAGITGLRKAWTLFDMANSGINLTLNATLATENKKVRELLDIYNMVTGGVAVTRMAVGGVKSIYNLTRKADVLNIGEIRKLLRTVGNGGDDVGQLAKADIESLEKMIQRVKAEASARGLKDVEQEAEAALAAISKTKKIEDLFKNPELNAIREQYRNGTIARKAAKYISLEEEAVIRFYTTPVGYKMLNKALRGEVEMTDFYRHYTETLDGALDKMPKYTTTSTYRGTGKAELEMMNRMEVGNRFEVKGFFSSSLEKDMAEHFRLKENGGMYQITSTSGVNISGISEASFEGEILFKSTAKFEIEMKTYRMREYESDPVVRLIMLKEIE